MGPPPPSCYVSAPRSVYTHHRSTPPPIAQTPLVVSQRIAHVTTTPGPSAGTGAASGIPIGNMRAGAHGPGSRAPPSVTDHRYALLNRFYQYLLSRTPSERSNLTRSTMTVTPPPSGSLRTTPPGHNHRPAPPHAPDVEASPCPPRRMTAGPIPPRGSSRSTLTGDSRIPDMTPSRRVRAQRLDLIQADHQAVASPRDWSRRPPTTVYAPLLMTSPTERAPTRRLSSPGSSSTPCVSPPRTQPDQVLRRRERPPPPLRDVRRRAGTSTARRSAGQPRMPQTHRTVGTPSRLSPHPCAERTAATITRANTGYQTVADKGSAPVRTVPWSRSPSRGQDVPRAPAPPSHHCESLRVHIGRRL